METGSCHGGMKAAILRIESNLKETDFFFSYWKSWRKKDLCRVTNVVNSKQDATVYWGLRCWHNTAPWFNHLHMRLFLFSSPHVDPAILRSDKCNLMSPHHPTPKQSSPHCLSLRMCHSFPLYFRNCNHMSEGTPGSGLHLEEQHYYRQFTLKFECIRRGSNHSGRDGGRGWMERWRD